MACLMGIYNRIDTSTVSGGSWLAALPLTNVQNRVLGVVARSTNAANASTIINLNIGSQEVIRIVALVNHNMSLAATYRIRLSNDVTFATSLLDTGTLDVWDTAYTSDTLEFEDVNWWSLLPTADDIAGFTNTLTSILAANTVCQYLRIEIFDSTNADGYVQIGRVFVGKTWKPTNDAEVGLDLGWQTDTTSQRSLGGTKFYQSRTPYRQTNFTLEVMEDDEGMAQALEVDRRTGLHKEILWVHDDADSLHAYRRRFLAVFKTLSPLQFPYANLRKKAYSVEEVL